jgi:hypothetical protein
MRPATAHAIRVALDTFTGADGGVGFVKFRTLIEGMDAKAADGDAAAIELVAIVTRFARLIEVAQR